MSFEATPVTQADTAKCRVPGYALVGPRADAVSWRSGIQGEWWSQRYDTQNQKMDAPVHGEWWVEGVQRPGSIG